MHIVETDKINEVGERCYTTYGPEIIINNLLYVDDTVGVGSPMVIESTDKKFKAIRRRKKLTLCIIKSVILKIGNKDSGYCRQKTHVSKGPINMTKTTKYL